MDRRVKERLVGASILVVLVVLIVPELLSGPVPSARAPEPVRNVTVDLATSKAPEPAPDAVETQPAAPDGAATVAAPAPAPAPASSTDRAVVSGSAGSKGAGFEPPPSPAPTRAAATVKTGGWALQLGSFASRANADKLVRRLKAQGFTVYTAGGGPASKARYRVRVGPLADRAAAAQMAARLKALGHASSLVPPAT